MNEPLAELNFTVPGMTCGHCVAAVEGELRTVAGVTDVSVDLDTKRVVVTGAGVGTAAVEAAVDEAGYEVVW